MIRSLQIRNYALIEHLELELNPGFTAITGETGSGKSILLGALGLILGERADRSALFDTDSKCIVEAELELDTERFESLFESLDLDFSPSSIFRREINSAGRSRAFINDTPVPLSAMKEIAGEIVDIHSQNDHLLLQGKALPLELLDRCIKKPSVLSEYQKAFREFKKARHRLDALQSSNAEQDLDYLGFQHKEIEELDITKDESAQLTEQLGLMESAEERLEVLQQGAKAIDSEDGAISIIQSVLHALRQLSEVPSSFSELSSRLESVRIELEDIGQEMYSQAEEADIEPDKLARMQDRMDVLNRLLSKHGLSSSNELIELKDGLEEKIQRIESGRAEREAIELAVKDATSKASGCAMALHEERIKAIPELKSILEKDLPRLGMPSASFEIEVTETSDLQASGTDDIQFLFKSEKDSPLQLLHKAASGGELSRIMLVMKQHLASKYAISSLIFDEIDTGVSGDISSRMADIMSQLAQGRQVIAITHLPQVAAKAEHHLRVFKDRAGERTRTLIETLDESGRLDELAKMLSGAELTAASKANAEALLKAKH